MQKCKTNMNVECSVHTICMCARPLIANIRIPIDTVSVKWVLIFMTEFNETMGCREWCYSMMYWTRFFSTLFSCQIFQIKIIRIIHYMHKAYNAPKMILNQMNKIRKLLVWCLKPQLPGFQFKLCSTYLIILGVP